MKNKIKHVRCRATAISPANIAFIKYWGKKDPKLNIPFNDSISMNLSDCSTKTEVEFSPDFKRDQIVVNGIEVKDEKKIRVVNILNHIRKMGGKRWYAKVVSENNFPSDAGIASSASGFSALALAGSIAIGLKLSSKDLSILARLGSGSACRSVIDGYSLWKKGKNNKSSYAVQLAKPNFWNLVDIVAVVDAGAKKSSSTEGHESVLSSPYFRTRLRELRIRILALKDAFLKKDFKKFGELVEEEAVSLHVSAMTSKPPIFYWNKGTFEVMESVFKLRETGILTYFTMDAGPNVHVICLSKDSKKINLVLKKLQFVKFTIINKPGKGTRLLK